MRNFIVMIAFELKDSLRAKWFYFYFIIFFGLMIGFLWSGITESQILGFTGLSRVLIAYIEITMVVLPLFILISVSRSLVMEKELTVLEYMLSFPVSSLQYFWGKFIGRLIVIIIPIYFSFIVSILWGASKGLTIPWKIYFIYATLVAALSICFLGMAYFISSLSKKQDTAVFTSFFIWFFFVALLDVVILGLLLKFNIDKNIVLAMALSNPLELFRIASFSLFDPKLAVTGPIAWTLLGKVGESGIIWLSCCYSVVLGLFVSIVGYIYFKNSDYL